MTDAKDPLVHDDPHTAAAARHVPVAEARKARCVFAEIRWRRTLSVLIKSFNKPERNYFFNFAGYSGRSFA
jgi:hypothetical protein